MAMMAPYANLSREEKIGLLVAGAAHVALAVAMLVQADLEREYTPPKRITVSLASDVSLQSTAPDPSDEPAASMAPTLSDQPKPETVEPAERTVPDTAPPVSAPQPRAAPQPRPQRTAAPTPTPTPRATQTQAPRPQATQSQAATGSRMNDSFLEGMSDSTGSQGQAADVISPQVASSLASAVNRQLKPHWNPPSGVEVERLETVVRFRLNRDGSLNGNPEVLRQTGVSDANRPQAGRHAEQAVRAVRLAAPFTLPERYYSGWRVVTSNFDNRLAQ